MDKLDKGTENKLKFMDNKPMIGACITGIFYFFTFSAVFVSQSGYLFVLIYLPGITFPLVTSYFNTRHLKNRVLFICGHFVFSILLYVFCLILFLSGADTGISFIISGLIGSLVYLTVSKSLYKEIIEKHLFVAVVLSGIVFLPLIVSSRGIGALGQMWGAISMGFGIFAWTVINGYVLNSAYKKSIINQ
jgi:hypothetical protein